MDIQYINDADGRLTGVLVPIKEWDAINKEREDLKRKLQEAELTLRFKKTLSDVKRYKEGKLETLPVQTLLDEL